MKTEQWRKIVREAGSWDSGCWVPPIELVTLVASGALPRNAAVLVAGSGYGIEAIYLSKLGWRVFGIDIDEDQVNLARLLAKRRFRCGAKFHQTDLALGSHALPRAWPGSFGVVLDRFCLCNFQVSKSSDGADGDDARELYFSRMAELIEPGGILVIRDRSDSDEPPSTTRRKLFERADASDFLGKMGEKYFEIPSNGIIANVRLTGDDTVDPHRIDAMIPIPGQIAVLRRRRGGLSKPRRRSVGKQAQALDRALRPIPSSRR